MFFKLTLAFLAASFLDNTTGAPALSQSRKPLQDFFNLLAGNLGNASANYPINAFVKINDNGRLDLWRIAYKFGMLTKFNTTTEVVVPFDVKDTSGNYQITDTWGRVIAKGTFTTTARGTTEVFYNYNEATGKVEAHTTGGQYISINTQLQGLPRNVFTGYTTDYMYDSFSNIIRNLVADTVKQFNDGS